MQSLPPFFFWNPGWPGTYYVTLAGLNLLVISLSLPPECLGLKAHAIAPGPAFYFEAESLTEPQVHQVWEVGVSETEPQCPSCTHTPRLELQAYITIYDCNAWLCRWVLWSCAWRACTYQLHHSPAYFYNHRTVAEDITDKELVTNLLKAIQRENDWVVIKVLLTEFLKFCHYKRPPFNNPNSKNPN